MSKKLFQNESDEILLKHIATMKYATNDLEDKANVLDVIMKFWPYIRPVLSIAKVFTNSKIDALIDAVIVWGDNYTTSHE